VSRRPVFITPGRHPFEVGPLLACVLVGIVMGIGGVRPPTMTRGLPEPLLTVWLILIAAGGLVGLVGAYWRGAVDDGLLVEFAGTLAVGAACTLYVIALLAGNPWPASVGSAGLLAGIAGGALGRAAQCVIEFRRVRRGVMHTVRLELPLLTEDGPPTPDGYDDGAGA
jgi:hypothetical protein